MSPDNFKNHQVFEKLSQINSRLHDQEAIEKINIENISFFQSSFKYISDRLKTTIPILVQESELNSLSSEIDSAIQQINSFLGNNNIGHINNAVNNFNSALNRIRNFPLPFVKGDFDFSKTVAIFEKIIKEKYNLLENKKDEIEKEIERQKAELKQKELDINLLFKVVETKETEIHNLNLQFQTEFNVLKTKANQEIETDREIFRREVDNDKETYKKEFDKLKNIIENDTSGIFQMLNKKLDEAKNIVNVIGNVGVTGNYQQIANEHKSVANIWRGVTIIFLSIFSGLLIWSIFDISSEGFDWGKTLIRIIAAAALSYPATYAARESTRHRKLETINRTAELELASLGPFIELLPDEKQQAIREQLVTQYFGNGNNDSIIKSKEDEELSISGFEKIVKSIGTVLIK